MEKFYKDKIKNIEEKIAKLEKLKIEVRDEMRKACTHDKKIRIGEDCYNFTYIKCEKCGYTEYPDSIKPSILYRLYKKKELEECGVIINGNCKHLGHIDKVIIDNRKQSNYEYKYKCTECDLVESDTEESVLKILYEIDETLLGEM